MLVAVGLKGTGHHRFVFVLAAPGGVGHWPAVARIILAPGSGGGLDVVGATALTAVEHIGVRGGTGLCSRKKVKKNEGEEPEKKRKSYY